jgi:hypothetical protein
MKKSHKKVTTIVNMFTRYIFFYIDNLVEKLQYSQYVLYFIFFCKAKFSLHHIKLKFLRQFGKINLRFQVSSSLIRQDDRDIYCLTNMSQQVVDLQHVITP